MMLDIIYWSSQFTIVFDLISYILFFQICLFLLYVPAHCFVCFRVSVGLFLYVFVIFFVE